MIQKYVKKPIEVEVMQFDGTNRDECLKWITTDTFFEKEQVGFCVSTYRGNMEVCEGDYIIKGYDNEFYCCPKEIFEETYSLVK